MSDFKIEFKKRKCNNTMVVFNGINHCVKFEINKKEYKWLDAIDVEKLRDKLSECLTEADTSEKATELITDVSKCYSKKDIDNAYDKGFNDGVNDYNNIL